MSDCEDVPAPGSHVFAPDEIILYGVKLNKKKAYAKIVIEGAYYLRSVVKNDDPKQGSNYAIAAIYGYAYEGHCYRFDRPKIFAFDNQNASEIDATGCGFTKPYKMWRLKRSDKLLELTAAVDEADKLILEANLPGKRAPNTYEGNMRLAHRGGRLTGQ